MKKKRIILISSITLTVIAVSAVVLSVVLPRLTNDDEPSSLTSTSLPTTSEPSTVTTYKITWKDYDGAVLKVDEAVEEGMLPSYSGDVPTREKTPEFSYEFAAWSPAVVIATSDATYTATYTETVNTYTVTWLDEDGTVLDIILNVAYGTLPVFTLNEPTKASSAKFSYAFSGWNPVVKAVTEDVTYTATYSETINSYTVTWKDYDGTVLATNLNVPYGTIPVYGQEPPKRAEEPTRIYTFDQWSPNITAVTKDVTYVATYTFVNKNFKITLDLNGGAFIDPSTSETVNVMYDSDFTLPVINSPTISPFGGWYYNGERIADEYGASVTDYNFTEDITVVAAFFIPIYTRADLEAVNQNVFASYRLMNDLDLSAEEWVPLANFAGDFNGQNFRVSGMTITAYQESVGLFGEVNEATISHLTVSDSHIEFATLSEPGNLYIGGIVGSSLSTKNLTLHNLKHENATIDVTYRSWGTFALGGLLGNYVTQSAATLNISNSNNSSPIIGLDYDNTGGLVGRLLTNYATITISNSFNSADMTITLYSGGLIGYIYDKSSTITLNDTYNMGTITGYAIVGGLIGQVQTQEYSNVTINNSYNEKDIITPATNIGGLIGLHNAQDFAELNINESYNKGNISGEEKLGGLIGTSRKAGQTQFVPEVHINNSYNLGDVNGTRGTLGGLVGQGNNYMTIINSYNKGAVSADREYAAGLVGWTQNGGAITNSLNFGDVTSTTVAGSIIGRNHNNDVIITNSFVTNAVFDNNGQPFVGATPGGTYVDIVTLNETFFSDTLLWDNEVWDLATIDLSNNIYPTLKIN